MFLPLPPDAELPPASLAIDAAGQDAYWSRAWCQERYASTDRDYEDYAPAYCVGYVGYAQYGGSFEDARVSLCANWARIRGDSRLRLEEALAPMRAGWDRVAGQALVAARTPVVQPLVDVSACPEPTGAKPFPPESMVADLAAGHPS